MLNRFAFRRKIYYLCIAKRREPANTGFFPLFLGENGPKTGCSTKHVEKFICRSENFLSESGFPLGEVGAQIDDIERNYSANKHTDTFRA